MNTGKRCADGVDWLLSEELSDCVDDPQGQLDPLDALAVLLLHTSDRVRSLVSEHGKSDDVQR